MSTQPDALAAIRPLRERETAELLGVTTATLRRWRWQRVGPPWSRPRGVKSPLYRPADVAAWLDAGIVDVQR